MLIEHGRALGAYEQAASWKAAVQNLYDAAEARWSREEEPETVKSHHATQQALKAQLDHLEQTLLPSLNQRAQDAMAAASRLMREVEHPGVQLARRVVRSWQAARRVWQASR